MECEPTGADPTKFIPRKGTYVKYKAEKDQRPMTKVAKIHAQMGEVEFFCTECGNHLFKPKRDPYTGIEHDKEWNYICSECMSPMEYIENGIHYKGGTLDG